MKSLKIYKIFLLIQNSSTIHQMYFQLSKGDVAQMVERSLWMQEAQGLIPRISNFSQN